MEGIVASEEMIFTFGNAITREAIRKIEGQKATDLGEPIPMHRNDESIPNWNKMLKVKFSSNRFLNTEIQKRDEVINRGELLHQGLAFIQTSEDLPSAVNQLLLQGMISTSEKGRILKQLQTIISHPKVSHWFAGEVEVKNEAEIILANGDVLRPDRVMISQKMAVVVDYKSGKPNRKYINQMDKYMHALLELGYRDVEGYLYYILRGQVEKISLNPQLGLQL